MRWIHRYAPEFEKRWNRSLGQLDGHGASTHRRCFQRDRIVLLTL
jgi:hypothetical protein